MSEITVGTKLVSLKSGLTATVTEINTKYKTALVDLSDGTDHVYALATLKDKRSWRVVDDEPTEVEETSEEVDTTEEVEEVPEETEAIEEQPTIVATTVDRVLLEKFTKREQSIIKTIYRDGTGYYVTVEKDGNVRNLHDKNLRNIGMIVRAIYKGEE